MANAFQIQGVFTSLTDGTTERTETKIFDEPLIEEFWAKVRVPGSASDVELKLNLLTDPKALVVIGGENIWFKKIADTGEKTKAAPMSIECDEDGLGINTIYLGNDGPAEAEVTIIAYE